MTKGRQTHTSLLLRKVAFSASSSSSSSSWSLLLLLSSSYWPKKNFRFGTYVMYTRNIHVLIPTVYVSSLLIFIYRGFSNKINNIQHWKQYSVNLLFVSLSALSIISFVNEGSFVHNRVVNWTNQNIQLPIICHCVQSTSSLDSILNSDGRSAICKNIKPLSSLFQKPFVIVSFAIPPFNFWCIWVIFFQQLTLTLHQLSFFSLLCCRHTIYACLYWCRWEW